MSLLLSKRQYEVIDNTFNWLEKTESKASALFRFNTNPALVGKESYTYPITKSFAEGDGILPRGSREVSIVNSQTEEITTKIVTLGRAFVIHREDFWANGSLDTIGVEVARNQLDLDIDNIAFKGNGNKTFGILNIPNRQTYIAPNGAGGSPLWENKTSNEILADIRKMISQANNKGKNRVTDLVVAPSIMTVLQTKTVGQDQLSTLLSYLQGTMGLNVTEVEILEKSSSLGTDPAILFDRNKVDLIIPLLPFRDSNAQSFDEASNFNSTFFATCGGIKAIDPKCIIVSENVGV